MKQYFPIGMGLMMGMMLPFMTHTAPAAGIAFILGHVAIAAALGLLAVLAVRFQKFQTVFANMHRPSRSHLYKMAGSAVAGFAIICLYCWIIRGTF